MLRECFIDNKKITKKSTYLHSKYKNCITNKYISFSMIELIFVYTCICIYFLCLACIFEVHFVEGVYRLIITHPYFLGIVEIYFFPFLMSKYTISSSGFMQMKLRHPNTTTSIYFCIFVPILNSSKPSSVAISNKKTI